MTYFFQLPQKFAKIVNEGTALPESPSNLAACRKEIEILTRKVTHVIFAVILVLRKLPLLVGAHLHFEMSFSSLASKMMTEDLLL